MLIRFAGSSPRVVDALGGSRSLPFVSCSDDTQVHHMNDIRVSTATPSFQNAPNSRCIAKRTAACVSSEIMHKLFKVLQIKKKNIFFVHSIRCGGRRMGMFVDRKLYVCCSSRVLAAHVRLMII